MFVSVSDIQESIFGNLPSLRVMDMVVYEQPAGRPARVAALQPHPLSVRLAS